jgi:hypothetical protein
MKGHQRIPPKYRFEKGLGHEIDFKKLYEKRQI